MPGINKFGNDTSRAINKRGNWKCIPGSSARQGLTKRDKAQAVSQQCAQKCRR